MRGPRFCDLTRDEQHANLLRRFRKTRREIEQMFRDEDYWNDEVRKPHEARIERCPKMVALLAWCDQKVHELCGEVR